MTGVITNITSRKQLERQLLSAGRFEALYGFAGRLAHDLNNPLMIVTGYAEELMQALKPSDPLRQEAGEILGAARRIGGIAAQLTEFARRAGQAGVTRESSATRSASAVENHRSRGRARRGGADGEPRAGPGHGGSGAAGRGAHRSRSPEREKHAAGTYADRHHMGRRDGGGTLVAHRLSRRQVRSYHGSR